MSQNVFRPCALIPVYNHGNTVGAVAAGLCAEGLPIFLVDDGSDAETMAQLAEIAGRMQDCTLLRLPVNRGKGAAVSLGILHAAAAGFTHAFQVDADGQHNLADVPVFLREAREHPEALVCGAAVFDVSIPPARRIGRRLTVFWVAAETLSRDIPEAMCGFRVYPLATACRLFSHVHMSRRMAFDIEILVRLHWRGVQIRFLPTQVIYPIGGVSNFRMVRDNLDITMVHTKLFVGMLVRLPFLLARRARSTAAA